MSVSINELIQKNDAQGIIMMFRNTKKEFVKSYDECMSEYNPQFHKVNDRMIRKDKKIKIPIEGKYDQFGEQMYKTKKVPRVRVSVPVQRVLVERSVGFLFGIPVVYKNRGHMNEHESKLFEQVLSVLSDNKMAYNDKKIGRSVFSERESAEIWYFLLDEKGKPTKMKVRIVSPSRGDALYPHYDEYDRMDAFARGYKEKDINGEIINHFDVYTSDKVYRYASKGGSDLALLEAPKRHGFSKIPVVYYRQEETEWECVQPIIERMEELISNWGDTNDYFGSPSYFVSGTIEGFAEKGEQGRVYTGTEGADMKVLSWDSSPQSMNAELSTLTNIIFSYSQTPDISFESMKQLSGKTSGVAIKLMFTDPHMKASMKIEQFGEMFTRRCNIIKNGIVTTLKPIPPSYVDSLVIEPNFTPYAPKNDSELVNMIRIAVGDKPIMSQEDGIICNPLVSNPIETMDRIKRESQEDAQGVTNITVPTEGEQRYGR